MIFSFVTFQCLVYRLFFLDHPLLALSPQLPFWVLVLRSTFNHTSLKHRVFNQDKWYHQACLPLNHRVFYNTFLIYLLYNHMNFFLLRWLMCSIKWGWHGSKLLRIVCNCWSNDMAPPCLHEILGLCVVFLEHVTWRIT